MSKKTEKIKIRDGKAFLITTTVSEVELPDIAEKLVSLESLKTDLLAKADEITEKIESLKEVYS